MKQSRDGRCTFEEEAHSYAIDGFPAPGVSAVCKGAGYMAPIPDSALPFIERKAALGKAVHAVTHYLETPELGILNPDWWTNPENADAIPYVEAFENFRKRERPELVAAEEVVYSSALYFAGMLDRVYRLSGKLVVADLKCAVKLAPWYYVQAGLYALAWEEMTAQRVDSIAVIHLTPKHRNTYGVSEGPDGWREDAEICARTYHWRARHGLIPDAITCPETALSSPFSRSRHSAGTVIEGRFP